MYINNNEDLTNGCPVRAENACNHDSKVSCSVDADCRPGGACEPNCGISISYCLGVLASFEGQVRYLGPPEAFDNNAASDPKWVGAKLQCTPLVRDWSPRALAADLGISEAEADTIYYYGAEVVPCSIHAVQLGTQACVDSANPDDCFSDPLEVRTALWGDVWPNFGEVNFTDIGAEVRAFKGIPFVVGDNSAGPNRWRSMLRGNEGAPGGNINFTDIGKTVDAFKRIAYREPGPTACP